MNPTDLYFSLPVALQNLACNVTSYKNRIVRYPKRFHELLAEYNARSEWSHDRLIAYQGERIARLVLHCYETVPHYRKVMDEGGIDPSSVRSIEDLKRFPVLTKEEVNRRPEDFLSSAYAGKPCIKRHTSGTTGSAFRFVMNREAFIEQWAVCWRYWCKLGLSFDQPHAMFGTRRIAAPDQASPPFWRPKAGTKELYFSAFHESPGNMKAYYDEIDRNGFTWIHGYPSLVVPLASYMVENDLHFSCRVKNVTLAAENLLAHQKRLISEAFGVDPRQHYGASEGTVNASENAEGRMYVDEDYCAMEFVPFGEGDHEIVGTSLTNYAMPLIRWRLKDCGSVACDENGFRYVSSLDGRTEDYVVLPNGVRVGRLARVFKDTVHFREVQIHQNADYSIVINAVRSSDDVSEDERTALDELRQSIGRSIPVRFNYVDRIEKTRGGGGKFKFVVSEVSQDAADGF